ncbi:MAG: hypothetical protein K6U03_03945 [Firmicutes bacterium]|nr:hypothetical protein [Bacillota bacterium]
MKMIKRACFTVAILLGICLFFGCVGRRDDNEDMVKDTVAIFIKSIKAQDIMGFRKLVSPSGLVVIRNFVTGGFGARGKDIRNYYKQSQVDFKFKVPGEEPVSVEWLFAESVKSKINKIPIRKVKGMNFGFKDNGQMVYPPTMELIEICSKIQEHSKKSEMKPEIFILNDKEFALTESDYIIGLSIGSWAVFEKASDKYYLRAIMDFR